jgi:hypothetical protein
LPLVAIVAFSVWKVRGRFARASDVGALRALRVLTISFLPLTLAWAVPTISKLGLDGFASEVLLLGSNAAEIYWRDHPPVELYAFAVAVGVIGFSALGRAVASGLIPLRLGVGLMAIGITALAVVAFTAGLMPEGRAVSVVHQLQNAAYWLAPLVHWGAFALIALRLARGDSSEATARLWVLTVCSVAMYWQLYPRTDFAHVMFAVPLCTALAVWLLGNVLEWWARGTNGVRDVTRAQLASVSVLMGALVAVAPMAPAVSSALDAYGGDSLTGSGPRLQISVEEAKSTQLADFGSAVDFLTRHTEPGEPMLGFPALGGLSFAAGLTNPVEHDYWYPERPDHVAEAKMLAILRASPPRFVATINTGWTFFFGSPPYFADAGEWVGKNYRLVRRFGRFDILARNDVVAEEPTLGGGLEAPAAASAETEPPAVADLTGRTASIRAWLVSVPEDRPLDGLLSQDLATALLQIRGLRDAGDLRGAAVLFSGYESDSERLRRESAAAASMMVKRHHATIHRWAGDLGPSDYSVYVTPLVGRARQQLEASDEGMRDLSTLVVEVASQVSP